jgi:polyribonucleotide nucleotidyltransferase
MRAACLQFMHAFVRAAEVAGIPDGFISHGPRHAFASAITG